MTLASARNAIVVEAVLVDGATQEAAAARAQTSQPTSSRILKDFKRDVAFVIGQPYENLSPDFRRDMVVKLLENAANARKPPTSR